MVIFNEVCESSPFYDYVHFVYKVYVKECGYCFPTADHKREMLLDSFDIDAQYLSEYKDKQIIAICRLNHLTDEHYADTFLEHRYDYQYFLEKTDHLFYVSKLLITEKYRRSCVLLRMLQRIYYRVKQYSDFILLIDCSYDLVPMYQKIGFKLYKDDFTDNVLGVKVPMYFDYSDKQYLKQVNARMLEW